MNALLRLSLACLASLSFALAASAQTVKPTDGTPPRPAEGAGGGYTGPGDTVPTGGGSSPGTDTGGVPVAGTPTAGPAPVDTGTGTVYAPGANPLAPRPDTFGDPASGNPSPEDLTPASRPITETPNSWKLWWHYNRWGYLGAGPGLSETGSGGFFIGRGERAETPTLLRASRAQMQDVVQPALIQALLDGGRPELEIYTLHALAKLRNVVPDPKLGGFADVVPRSLASGNQEVCEKAVLALGIRGEDRFLPWLVSVLEDRPEGRQLLGRQRIGLRVRAFAAYGLGLLGARTQDPGIRVAAYDALVEALWVERVEVQAACLLAIGLTPMPLDHEYIGPAELFQGKTRVDQVLELLNFFEDTEQSFVARSQAPGAIARLVEDGPESLRARAVTTMLLACGEHSKELREVQDAAVRALGRLGRSGGEPIDEQILSELERIAFRSSQDRSTRFQAMIALGHAARRRGTGDEPYAAVEPVRKVFLSNLTRSRGESQAWTVLGLGILEQTAAERGERPSPASGTALRKLFERSRSAEVVGALAIALGMMRDLESEELLRARMLDAGEEHVRGYTALALGMMRGPTSVKDLQLVLTESTQKPFVVENAAIALALLGDQSVGGTLFEILERSARPQVQASVASAMGWIKDPRPLNELCEQLLDPRKNETGRAWTAVAIGRMCDEDEWPWVSRLSTGAQYDVWLPTLVEPQLQNGLLDLP